MGEASHLEHIRERMRQGRLRLSRHATKEMGLRGRTLMDVQGVILVGEVIRVYPEEQPYPEYLIMGYPQQADDPCYVVVTSNDAAMIVTGHNYDPEVYEADHRMRRRQP
jgi:hypothetical protein